MKTLTLKIEAFQNELVGYILGLYDMPEFNVGYAHTRVDGIIAKHAPGIRKEMRRVYNLRNKESLRFINAFYDFKKSVRINIKPQVDPLIDMMISDLDGSENGARPLLMQNWNTFCSCHCGEIQKVEPYKPEPGQ